MVDIAAALAPGFAARVPAQRLREATQDRAERFTPIRVVGVDSDGPVATARFRTRHGELWVAHVEVEPEAPYRIAVTYT